MQRIPLHIFFMIAVTGLYLSAEVPFATYLIHIMGGQSTSEDIHQVESFGRILTGVAVFIAILGGVLVPRMVCYSWRPIKIVTVFLIVGAGTVGTVYQALNFYGNIVPEFASVQSLRNAYLGTIARKTLAERGIGELTPVRDNNAWNAFVATAAATSDVPALVKATGRTANDMIAADATQVVGTVAQVRARLFNENFDDVRRSYNDYVDGSNSYNRALRNIDNDGAREWNKYISDLHARFPQGIPLRGWTTASIRSKVRERLPELSNDWNIVDRTGFMIAYRHRAEREIRQRYADKVQGVMGSGHFVRPGLDFESFLADGNVQQSVRNSLKSNLGIDVGNAVISPSMSAASFDTIIYKPLLVHTVQQMSLIASSNEPISGNNLQIAKKAFQAATLPATALLLSLAGAALHIFKVTSYIAQAFGYALGSIPLMYGRRRFVFGSAALISGFLVMFLIGDNVTSTRAYQEVSRNDVYALVVKNAVSIQPSFEILSQTLSKTGIWSVISADLPAPKPYKVLVANGSTPAVDPVSTSSVSDVSESLVIPVPTPRPAV